MNTFEITRRREKAKQHLNDLACGKPFQVRIPVQEDDSDVIFQNVIEDSITLQKEVARLSAELINAKTIMDLAEQEKSVAVEAVKAFTQGNITLLKSLSPIFDYLLTLLETREKDVEELKDPLFTSTLSVALITTMVQKSLEEFGEP